MLMVQKADQKSNKMSKLNPNSDRKANLTPSTSRSGSKDKDKDKSKSRNQNQKKPDLTDKLGKDSKLTAQECQQRLDNELCLLCGKSGHMVHDCPSLQRLGQLRFPNPRPPRQKSNLQLKPPRQKNS